MSYYSTREAAKKLGIPSSTLANYVAAGKVPRPVADVIGKTTTLLWTEEEIEAIRRLLPKIANGRKTRYQKKQAQQSAKPERKTPARAPALHKIEKGKGKKTTKAKMK